MLLTLLKASTEKKAMRASTKRLRIPVVRTAGLRKPLRPRPSPDLRVFRVMSKFSRQAIRAYVDGLIGPY